VTSLQREIAVKEQKIQQLKQEVEKTKKANREKDNQLAAVSAKVSVPSAGLIGGLAWNRKIRWLMFLSVKDLLDIRKNLFTEGVVVHWYRLPVEVVVGCSRKV